MLFGLFSYAEELITKLSCFLMNYLYCPYSQELLNTLKMIQSIMIQSINEMINKLGHKLIYLSCEYRQPTFEYVSVHIHMCVWD